MWHALSTPGQGTESPGVGSLRHRVSSFILAAILFTNNALAQAPAKVAEEKNPVAADKPIRGQDPFANGGNAIPMVALRAAQPARVSRLPSLNDLTQVKLDKHLGELQLVMMLEGFRTEKRTGRVVKMRQEQRTRTIRDANGAEKQQTYTVQVPVAEEGEVDVKIPAGRKPLSKPASEFQFFDLTGNALTIEAAAEKLKSLQPAFLLDRFAGQLPEIPELYRQALNEKCLVIVTEEALRDLGNQTLPGQMLPARVFEVEPRFEIEEGRLRK